MEKILSLAMKSARAAEVFHLSSEETQVRFESNRLKQVHTNQATSVALRVIKDGRLGYATATGEDRPEELVRNALETAAFGMKAEFTFPEATSFPSVEIADDAVMQVPMPDMVSLGEEMIAAVTDFKDGIICDASITRGTMTMKIMNSSGGMAEYCKTFFGIDIEGTVIEGTDMLFVGESESSCHPVKNTKWVIDTVRRQLERASRKASVPTKIMPVIFTSNSIISLIMPLLAATSGKTVLEGASPLGDKLGKTVLDTGFSLYDNPLLAFRPGSRPCDDEGVPSQVTPLIENGIVKNFYYDLQTAARARTKSTGNGARGRGSLPSPSISQPVIAPGKTNFDDMLADIKEGLIIEQLMGADQGNLLGGDFSGNVLLGYKVENGKIVGRVKDTMVSGNVYHLLKEIAGIGSEPAWVSGFLYAPPLYCSGLSVSSKA